jgi:hypothetical protein
MLFTFECYDTFMIFTFSEYVKTLDHIYHYNNRRKMEFIKKGMGNADPITTRTNIFYTFFCLIQIFIAQRQNRV